MARILISLLVLAMFANASRAEAQSTPDEALALVDRYLALHNAHDLEGVMALYAEDAEFTLSRDRGVVRGKDAIRNLEMFDVLAGSNLAPYGLTATLQENGWRVDLDGVVEASSIFSAAGAPIVIAEPTDHAFVLRDGKIQAIVQPEIRPACWAIVTQAFNHLTELAKLGSDPRLELVLNDKKRLTLTPATIPLIVLLLEAHIDQSNPELINNQLACSRFG